MYGLHIRLQQSYCNVHASMESLGLLTEPTLILFVPLCSTCIEQQYTHANTQTGIVK